MTNLAHLIGAIRRWQATNTAYLECRQQLPNGILRTKRTRDGFYAVNDAARVVTEHVHTDQSLEAFTALADFAEIALALVGCVEVYTLPFSEVQYGEFAGYSFELHVESRNPFLEAVRQLYLAVYPIELVKE